MSLIFHRNKRWKRDGKEKHIPGLEPANMCITQYTYVHSSRWRAVYHVGFPGGLDGKESGCNAGDPGVISESERPPEEGNGNPLQYSCLENPHKQRSLAGYSPWGHKRVGHDWVNNTFTLLFLHDRYNFNFFFGGGGNSVPFFIVAVPRYVPTNHAQDRKCFYFKTILELSWNTVDPWISWAWTAWVHRGVFLIVNTTDYMICSWLNPLRSHRYKGLTKLQTRLLIAQRLGTPTPVLFKSQLYNRSNFSSVV